MATMDLGFREASVAAVADDWWRPEDPTRADAVRRDPINLGLALVNWLILLLLMCTLLLAKTLPNGSDVMGGVASVTCKDKTCTQVQPAR